MDVLLPPTLAYVDPDSKILPKAAHAPDFMMDPSSPFAKAEDIYGSDISSLNDDLKTLLRRYPEALNKHSF